MSDGIITRREAVIYNGLINTLIILFAVIPVVAFLIWCFGAAVLGPVGRTCLLLTRILGLVTSLLFFTIPVTAVWLKIYLKKDFRLKRKLLYYAIALVFVVLFSTFWGVMVEEF